MPRTAAPMRFHGAKSLPDPHVGSRTARSLGPRGGTRGCSTSQSNSASQFGVKYCACLDALNCRKPNAWFASRPAYAVPEDTSTDVTSVTSFRGCVDLGGE